MTSSALSRVLSVDVFRALTMLAMIFVNDLWTLSGIPTWLEHAPATVDALGFADVVFPCFLFIVGLAIPYAIHQRLDKGDSPGQLVGHIVLRSAALLIMGVFTVNVPELNQQATGMSSDWFQLLMVLAFFLIWNQYPSRQGAAKFLFIGLQLAGAGLLIYLAVMFRGGPDGQVARMAPQWWGILGLIGWTYLTCALLYLIARQHPTWLLISWFLFILLTIAGQAGWLETLWPDGLHDWILGNGAFATFALTGILVTLLMSRYQPANHSQPPTRYVAGSGVLLVVAGLVSRHFVIISKIQATSTWVFLCCGLACIGYAGLYWLVDQQRKAAWFRAIKPAGTSTLTCYLLPYIYYSLADLFSLSLPDWAKTGALGLIKSVLFALLIIGLTAVLGKLRIKLKL